MWNSSRAVFWGTVLLSVLFLLGGRALFSGYAGEPDGDLAAYKAKVISVDGVEETPAYLEELSGTTIYFTAKLRSGPEKGSLISGIQNIDNMFYMQDKEVQQGDSILAAKVDTGEAMEWIFVAYNRVDGLAALFAVFLLLIVLIGGRKGVHTIFALVLTCLMIFLVYVPSILSGFNVYLSTLIIGTVIILMSLVLINGADRKTLCAVLGNLGGVLLAAALAFLMNRVLRLTGFIDEHYIYLTFISPDRPLSLIGIAWGGMVLGSIGAIMDVSMTIASAMDELATHMHRRTFAKLARSGMNIGRDAIGTMTNTLILAYIGGSLALVLLLIVNTKDTLYLFSMEMIAVQVVQAVVGSIGILFAVPFTALFAAYIYTRGRPESDEDDRYDPD